MITLGLSLVVLPFLIILGCVLYQDYKMNGAKTLIPVIFAVIVASGIFIIALSTGGLQ